MKPIARQRDVLQADARLVGHQASLSGIGHMSRRWMISHDNNHTQQQRQRTKHVRDLYSFDVCAAARACFGLMAKGSLPRVLPCIFVVFARVRCQSMCGTCTGSTSAWWLGRSWSHGQARRRASCLAIFVVFVSVAVCSVCFFACLEWGNIRLF